MRLRSDYFLLYHGKNAQEIEHASLLPCINSNETYPIYSLVLTIKKNNFQSISTLKSFKLLLASIYEKEITSLESLYPLQNSILSLLEDAKTYTIELFLEHINYLKNETILPLENYNRLDSFFSNVTLEQNESHSITIQNKTSDKQLSFQDKRDSLIEKLYIIAPLMNKTLSDSLLGIEKYLDNQHFSIGITGVINAGKSTMLNALIGKEVLGSSVVPETANLTVIKYTQSNPKAEVLYWNKAEWNSILKSSQEKEAMAEFVRDTEEAYNEELDKYLQEESFSQTIAVEEIAKYTSVKQSANRCNLVKYVNLYHTLDFLKDGIEIVDTPGLDDPVVQREEITKEYLAKCDLMLHLMNVNQSATYKDVEFIIDAILYQNISKILIVLTHIDSVTPLEVQEVITYTKESIKKALEELNKSTRVDYILEHISFIPISARVALMHKLQSKELEEDAMSLQESGILALEGYLQDTLFGDKNGRSELIIQSASIEFDEHIQRQIYLYKYELEVLSHSKEELEAQLISKKENRISFIKLMNEDISIYKEESLEYINRLDLFLQEEFLELVNIIHQRVYSDISYTYETKKTLPPQERIKIILQTAIKDGIVDIIRDYKYKLIQKEELIFTNFEKKFILFNSTTDKTTHKPIDIQDFYHTALQDGLMNFSTDIFTKIIIHLITQTKASKYESIQQPLLKLITNSMHDIIGTLSNKLKKQALDITGELYKKLRDDIHNIEVELVEEESFILSQLDGSIDKDSETPFKILQKIKELEVMQAKVLV